MGFSKSNVLIFHGAGDGTEQGRAELAPRSPSLPPTTSHVSPNPGFFQFSSPKAGNPRPLPFLFGSAKQKKPQRTSPTRGRRRLLTRESLGSLTHRSATRSLESNSDPKVFFFVYFSFFVCVFLFLKCLSSTGTPPPQEFVPPAKPSVGAGRQRSARQLDLKYPQYPNIQTSTFTPRVQKSQEGMEEKQGLGWGSWGGAPNLPKTPKLGHKTDASLRGCPSVGLVFGELRPAPLLAAF